MLAHNKVQGGNSQDQYYQLPPPQQQPQRHEHRSFVHPHQIPEHEHGQFRSHQAQTQTKRMFHQEDKHDSHYSVGQDPHNRYHHHQLHAQQSHRQVDLSRPRSRDMTTATTLTTTPTIHPTIANMISPMSPHRPRSHPYPLASPNPSPPRSSSAYRSFSPLSSSSSSSSASSSRNVSLSPGLESEAMMHLPSRSRLTPSSSPPHRHLHHHHHNHHHQHHHRQPSNISAASNASRGLSASLRLEGDEMAAETKREYEIEELSSDSMMDQCEPQREWSTSSSQQTNSPSPIMCSSSCAVPSSKEGYLLFQQRSHQNYYRHRQEKEKEDEVVEEGLDRELKRSLGDQYTPTSLSHQQHPRGTARHWHPHRWDHHDMQQQQNEHKRVFNHGLEREQEKQQEEHIIQPPVQTSRNQHHHHFPRRGSGSTNDSTTATVTATVLPSSSSSSPSSTLSVPPSSSLSSLSSSSSVSLTRRMADLCPPRKQQRSSHAFYPGPNSPNNGTGPSPQHSSLVRSSSSFSSSSLTPLCPSAVTSMSLNASQHAPAPTPCSTAPFALSLSSLSKTCNSNSGGRSLPPPLPISTSSSISVHQQQQAQPHSPTTKRPIEHSESRSYEYRSKAQRMLYERHPPSPVNSNRSSSSDNNSSPPSPLSHVSDKQQQHSAPSSPPPVHHATLASRASFGSLRDYQPERLHSHQQKQLQCRYPMQRQHQQHHQEDRQYPQQMSLPPSSSQPHYEQENRLPQIGRSQHQQYNQSHCHSYHGHPSGSGSGSFGPELPQLSSIEFSQRHLIDPESRPGSSASSGRPNSSGSAVFSFLPHPPIPSTMNNQSHGSHSRMASMSLRDGGSTSTPASSSVMSLPSAHHLFPGTEGMTVVRNEEGAIMVYNPITDAMTFRCELCPEESFGRIHDLKRHQTSKHQEMTWPCDFCHRPFVRRDALLRHYTVKAARDDGLHPASHEVDKLLAARARAKMLY